jgi:GTPase SAR1 family protein
VELHILLVGNRAVGKSSLKRRFVNDEFSEVHHTYVPGMDVMAKITKRVKVQIWEVQGQEYE